MRRDHFDILVVDDDPDDRLMLAEAFSELNCENRVTIFDSSLAFHKALSELRELSPLPTLVVLDYNLPGADGAVVLSLLKNDAILSTIPVVMYSNCMSRTQETDCLVKGAVKCFEKGSTYTEVVTFCKQLCQEAFGTHTQV